MIFVTVGTHHQPFERLLSALSTLEPSQLVVQHGPAPPPPHVGHAAPYMPYDEMLRWLREADAVVTHAGVGSILCATREGHVPLVVPRRRDLGEHVDDHQVELARALEERGKVVVVWDIDALAESIAKLPPRSRPAGFGAVESSLSQSVQAALRGEPRPQRSKA